MHQSRDMKSEDREQRRHEAEALLEQLFGPKDSLELAAIPEGSTAESPGRVQDIPNSEGIKKSFDAFRVRTLRRGKP